MPVERKSTSCLGWVAIITLTLLACVINLVILGATLGRNDESDSATTATPSPMVDAKAYSQERPTTGTVTLLPPKPARADTPYLTYTPTLSITVSPTNTATTTFTPTPTTIPTTTPKLTLLPGPTPTSQPLETETATVTLVELLSDAATKSQLGSDRESDNVASGTVEIHFIDVGQGDATLILGPDASVLIDGGDATSPVVGYLQALGVPHLDVVIATHPNADHIGGLIDVLRAVPVNRVVTNGEEYTTLTYERFLDAIIRANSEYVEVSQGDQIVAGNLVLDVLNPAALDSSVNNDSLVLRFTYGHVSVLLTGDIEATQEARLVSAGMPLGAQILKVAHHGSNDASSPAFLRQVQPEVAVYSAGAGNQYGHPSAETLGALSAIGAQVYGTDENGTVIVSTDGTTYEVQAARSGTPRAPPTERPTVADVGFATPSPTPETALPAAPVAVEPTIAVLSLTSPISHGSNATLAIRTVPGAACDINVIYKSGASEAAGLGSQVANGEGDVTWGWKVGTRTTPGTWRIEVTCTGGGQSVHATIPFEVR